MLIVTTKDEDMTDHSPPTARQRHENAAQRANNAPRASAFIRAISTSENVAQRDVAGLFRRGELSLVTGPPHVGKSTIVAALAARHTREHDRRSDGVVATYIDDASLAEIAMRLYCAQPIVKSVVDVARRVENGRLRLLDLRLVSRRVIAANADMLIVDPAPRVLRGASDVRRLVDLAHDRDVAVVLVADAPAVEHRPDIVDACATSFTARASSARDVVSLVATRSSRKIASTAWALSVNEGESPDGPVVCRTASLI